MRVAALMSCFSLQDDLKKFVSEPPLPPQLVEVPEEGKAKARSGGKWARETTPLLWKTRLRGRRGGDVARPLPAAVEVQPSWLTSHPSRSRSSG
jgi:hypothetical protein